jgi:hypothetical protein
MKLLSSSSLVFLPRAAARRPPSSSLSPIAAIVFLHLPRCRHRPNRRPPLPVASSAPASPYHPASSNLPRCRSTAAQAFPLSLLRPPPYLASASSQPQTLRPRCPTRKPKILSLLHRLCRRHRGQPRRRQLRGAASLLHLLHLRRRRGEQRR